MSEITQDIFTIVTFENGKQLAIGDLLQSVTHYRGFRLAGSYCIIDVINPHIESMNEFHIHDTFTLQYQRGSHKSPIFHMEIFNITNHIMFSNVGWRVIGVEPGFIRLLQKVQQRAFHNQKVSDIFATAAQEASLETNIQTTSGEGNFIQPNMSNLHFLLKYLQPIAIDSGGRVPYLFTIDNNMMYFMPPTLQQKPQSSYVLDSTIDTLVRNFRIKNLASQTDLSSGGSLQTYGYDFTEKGLITTTETLDAFSTNDKLNKYPYETPFTRQQTYGYDEEWQLIAASKNRQARNQFMIEVDAFVDGSPLITFDKILQFTLPSFGIQKLQEYSGLYYVYEVCHVIQLRSFATHILLKSNSLLKNSSPSNT